MFSESEEGLRKMLQTMEKYCAENELTLNTDKTKCMIFNKGGKLLKTAFHYNGEKLENVNKFKYLGFLITPSGEIKSGLLDLRDRALKAFYKLKNALGDPFRSNVKTTLHLFDTLIKPILMYMSDFWGGLKLPDEKHNPIEKLHYMFCKQVLGVQKQTTNIGVLLELGRMPLKTFAEKSAIKNWERIRTGKINELLKNSQANATIDDLPWISHIKSILESHNLENYYSNPSQKRKYPFIHKLLFKKQCSNFKENAFEMITNPDSKLRTYGLLKTKIGCEKYLLEIKNEVVRQSFTKFRLSNHVLNIEKLRHTTPKTPKENRFCPFCPKRVEDEVHFLLECPIYRIPRKEMIDNLTKEKPSFRREERDSQFIELMRPENVHLTSKTIHRFFEIREFLFKSPRGYL